MASFKLAFQDRNIVTAGELGHVNFFDIETQEVIDHYLAGDAFITSLDLSTNGKYLALGNCQGTVYTIDLERKEMNKLECHGKQVRGVAFNCTNEQLVTTSDDSHVNLVDPVVNQLVRTLTGHASGVNSVHCSPVHSDLFVTCGYDRTLRLWDTRLQQSVQVIRSHTDNVWAAKFDKAA